MVYVPRSGKMIDRIVSTTPSLCPKRFDLNSNLWPTPTAHFRPNEGSMRLLRKKVLNGELEIEDAVLILGKSPFDEQGILWSVECPLELQDREDKILDHVRYNKLTKGGRWNANFLEWLMGFTLGWTELNTWARLKEKTSDSN